MSTGSPTADDIFKEVITLFADLNQTEREAMFAKLSLCLIEEVGDMARVQEILRSLKDT